MRVVVGPDKFVDQWVRLRKKKVTQERKMLERKKYLGEIVEAVGKSLQSLDAANVSQQLSSLWICGV